MKPRDIAFDILVVCGKAFALVVLLLPYVLVRCCFGSKVAGEMLDRGIGGHR